MLPIEFIIPGPPVSQQTRHRKQLQAWKDKVRTAALQRWPSDALPVRGGVRIIVQYFHEKPTVRIGLIYDDDRQIIDAITQKRPIDDPIYVRHISLVLAEGFSQGDEFVYIRIENVMDRARLLP